MDPFEIRRGPVSSGARNYFLCALRVEVCDGATNFNSMRENGFIWKVSGAEGAGQDIWMCSKVARGRGTHRDLESVPRRMRGAGVPELAHIGVLEVAAPERTERGDDATNGSAGRRGRSGEPEPQEGNEGSAHRNLGPVQTCSGGKMGSENPKVKMSTLGRCDPSRRGSHLTKVNSDSILPLGAWTFGALYRRGDNPGANRWFL